MRYLVCIFTAVCLATTLAAQNPPNTIPNTIKDEIVVTASAIPESVEDTPATVSVIFHGLIADLSAEALALSALFPPGSAPRAALRRIVRVPSSARAAPSASSSMSTRCFAMAPSIYRSTTV